MTNPLSPTAEHKASGSQRVGRSAKRGGMITLTAQAVHVIIGIVAAAILARLLTPAAFGLYAIASVPFAVVATLREFGLSASIVKASQVSGRELSGLFWLSLRYGAMLAAVLLLLTPLLAWFYTEPWLLGALPTLAAALFLQSAGVVPLGLLRREMRFGTVVAAELLAYSAAAGAAVAIAAAGGGAWSLVLQVCLQQVGVAVAVLVLTGITFSWHPTSWHSAAPRSELHRFIRFGWEATGARVILNAGRYYDFAMLGRFAGTAALGLYERAYQWASFPARQVQAPLVYVAVSGLSDAFRKLEQGEAARDPDAVETALRNYRRAVRLGLGLQFGMVFPALMLLIIEAPAVVRVLLGEQWLEASPLLVILSAAALFSTLGRSTKWIYLAEGQTARQLRWSIIETVVLVAAVTAGLPFAATGVALAVLGASMLSGPAALAYCVKTSRLRNKDAWAPTARVALAAAIAAASCLLADAFAPLPDATLTLAGAFFRCAAQAALFGVVYAVATLSTRGGRDMISVVLPVRWKLRSRLSPG